MASKPKSQPLTPDATLLPFIPGPSRIIIHRCTTPTGAPTATPIAPANHQTTVSAPRNPQSSSSPSQYSIFRPYSYPQTPSGSAPNQQRLPSISTITNAPPRQSVTSPPPPQPLGKPITLLALSLPLTQRIHSLLLTSRRIERLARQLYAGQLPEAEVTSQMDALEKKYDALREAIESELEGAWVDRGWLGGSISSETSESQKKEMWQDTDAARGTKRSNEPEYSDDEDDELLSDSDAETEGHNGRIPSALRTLHRNSKTLAERRLNKKRKLEHRDGITEDLHNGMVVEDNGVFPLLPTPIGIPMVLRPLGGEERKRIESWAWGMDTGVGKGVDKRDGSDGGSMSPRGMGGERVVRFKIPV